MSNDRLCYKKCLVASIDVLGCKQGLSNDSSAEVLNMLHLLFRSITRNFEENNRYFSLPRPYVLKAFSDNIVIVRECISEREIEICLHNFACAVTVFQSKLFTQYGYICRGGIAYGDSYIDDTLVLGKALVEAYTLESEIATYPRVVLSRNLEVYANKFMSNEHTKAEDFSRDSDGYLYVDYVRGWFLPLLPPYEILRGRMDFVNRIIASEKTPEKVVQKYQWLKERLVECYDEQTNGEQRD